MPKQLLSIPSFTAGELSSSMEGRTDFAKYFNGATNIENFVVLPHGPVTRRPGTYFVSEIKTSSAKTRLIPFTFSTEQTYILEFGNNYIRFFKDSGQIVESNKTITAITKANPAVVTSSSHGFENGDFVTISAVVGMTEVNNTTFKVSNKTTNTFELQDVDGNNINSSSFTTYSSAGVANRIYQITTEYTTAQLFDLKFAQSADVMYLCHPDHEPMKLSRTGHTSWSLTEVDFGITGPYMDVNTTTTTLTPASAGTGTGVNITASSTTGINNDQGWLTTDVGRTIKFNGGEAEITARTNSTVVVCTIVEAFTNTDATVAFQLGSFSNTTGFPSSVSFFEQRLVFAATNDQPQTIFFSKSGDYENMSAGVNDDDAMVYTIASNQVNAIKSMKATRTLIVMTTGGEYSVSAGNASAITPTNISIVKQSNYGSAGVDALSIGNATIFLQRAKRKIRELAYNFDTDGYVAPDLTILAAHISESGITQMDYQQEPHSVVWATRTDGVLSGLTYNRLENVVAWHRHILGGKSDTTKNIIQQQISFTANSSNVSTASNTITISSHGLSTGDPVYYYAASNVIGGLNVSSLYYAIATDSNTIKLATTATNATAGTAISLTSAPGSDTTQYIYQGVNISSNFIYSVSHGFKTGDIFYYDNTGTAIGGLSENTKYYIEKIDNNQIKLYSDKTLATVVSLTSAHTSEQTDNILTHAQVESVAVIDGDTDEDQVYVIVQRWINGAVRRYVEYFTPFDFSEDVTAFHYLDSGLSYVGDETSTLSGLDHLVGEVVDVIGEGSTQTSKTVSASGGITLDNATEQAKVGLLYSSDLQTMRLDEGYTETTQTKTKRIYDLSIRFQDTVGASVGPNAANLTAIDFRASGSPMNLPIPLFTGDKTIEFDTGYGTEGLVYVQQPQALPMTILGIYPRLETESV